MKTNFRWPDELHVWAAAEAERRGESLNALILRAVWGMREGGLKMGQNEAKTGPKEESVERVAQRRKPSKLDLAVKEVWDYYMQVIKRNPRQYTLTKDRKAAGLARVKDLLPRTKSLEGAVGVMKLCVDRLKGSAYHNGQNEQRKKYLDWEILFRSTDKLEFWMDDQRWGKQEERNVRTVSVEAGNGKGGSRNLFAVAGGDSVGEAEAEGVATRNRG